MFHAAELQDLTRCLLAAGYARSEDGKETHLLYVDTEESFLEYQQWSGKVFIRRDLVASSVRPNSTASFLITSTRKQVICISPSSTLNTYTYDPEEQEWFELDESGIDGERASDENDIVPLSQYSVHPDGKLASSVDANGRIHVVFQDQSQCLIYLDNSWAHTTLPVNPVVGSPLSISTIGNTPHIYYISAEDNFIHEVTGENGNWNDMIKHAIDTKFNTFMIAENESADKELYVMTEDNTLLKISAEGRVMELGTVKMGKFVSGRSVDRCVQDAWNGNLTEDGLKNYLASDPSCINIPGSEHSLTPLAAACIRGRLDIVLLLLRYHADPNALSIKSRAPLYYATSTRDIRDRLDIVRALLEAGANVDECSLEDGLTTPLMNAIIHISDQDVAKELLRHGASLTAKDLVGDSAETLAVGTPMEGALVDNSRPFERQLIETIVALIVFIVAYSGSRVKNLVAQVVTRLNDNAENERTQQASHL